ncbi:polysaccharide pyruvyl transferase family protein [Chloroflexota bacterium]
MRKRITLINFPTEIYYNWGCKASCKGLRKIVEEKYPGSILRTHPIHFELPNIRIPRDPEKWEPFISRLADLDWREFPDMKWADIVILDGEGSIHEFNDERTNDFAYLKLLAIFAAKRLFGKQTMIVNHSLDFQSETFKNIAQTVYSTCDYISVREQISQRKALSIGIHAELTGDSVFLLPERNISQAELKEKFRVPDKYYCFFLSQLIDVAPDYLNQLCQNIWTTTKLPAVFFILSQREKDVLQNIRDSDTPFQVIDYFVEPEDIIAVLKSASFSLSGRFHAAVFSTLANTPFIGFRANTHKIAGLVEMLGYQIPEMIFGETDISDIISAIKTIFENRDNMKSDLRESVLKIKQMTMENNVAVLELTNPSSSLSRKIQDELEFSEQRINRKLGRSIYRW